jgi:hypothetical protein
MMLSAGAIDLGLGDALKTQLEDQEEERKKRLKAQQMAQQQQQAGGLNPGTMSLYSGAGGYNI